MLGGWATAVCTRTENNKSVLVAWTLEQNAWRADTPHHSSSSQQVKCHRLLANRHLRQNSAFSELNHLRTTTLRLSKLFLPLLSLFDRRQRMQPTTALIVDCGSGFTRATVFSRDARGRICACEAHEHAGLDEAWRERRVVDALVEGGAALRDWAASIQALVDATGCTRAVVGTTGGLPQLPREP